jgi:hypothetical protein
MRKVPIIIAFLIILAILIPNLFISITTLDDIAISNNNHLRRSIERTKEGSQILDVTLGYSFDFFSVDTSPAIDTLHLEFTTGSQNQELAVKGFLVTERTSRLSTWGPLYQKYQGRFTGHLLSKTKNNKQCMCRAAITMRVFGDLKGESVVDELEESCTILLCDKLNASEHQVDS